MKNQPETPRTDAERVKAQNLVDALGFGSQIPAEATERTPHWSETERATPEALEQLRLARLKAGMLK